MQVEGNKEKKSSRYKLLILLTFITLTTVFYLVARISTEPSEFAPEQGINPTIEFNDKN